MHNNQSEYLKRFLPVYLYGIQVISMLVFQDNSTFYRPLYSRNLSKTLKEEVRAE